MSVVSSGPPLDRPSGAAASLADLEAGTVRGGRMFVRWLRFALIAAPVAAMAVYAVRDRAALSAAAAAIARVHPAAVAAALGFVAVTFVASAMSLRVAARQHLPVGSTVRAELAGTFLNRLLPNGIGRLTVTGRYLTARGISSERTGAALTAATTASFVVHTIGVLAALVVTARPVSGHSIPLRGLLIVAGVAGTVAIGFGLSARGTRRLDLLRRWIGVSIGHLVVLGRDRRALTALLAWTSLISAAYVAALWIALHAVGSSASVVAVAAVYLVGSAVANGVPVPGGVGAVEAALVAGLVTRGVPTPTALAGVMLFRLLSFWLPSAVGAWAWSGMARRGDLSWPRRVYSSTNERSPMSELSQAS